MTKPFSSFHCRYVAENTGGLSPTNAGLTSTVIGRSSQAYPKSDPSTAPKNEGLTSNDEPGDGGVPEVNFEFLDLSGQGHKGLAAQCVVTLREGQCVTFVLRIPPASAVPAPDSGADADVGAQEGVDKGGVGEVAHEEGGKEWKIAAYGAPRALDDPLLTKELMASVLHVRSFSFFRHK